MIFGCFEMNWNLSGKFISTNLGSTQVQNYVFLIHLPLCPKFSISGEQRSICSVTFVLDVKTNREQGGEIPPGVNFEFLFHVIIFITKASYPFQIM